MNKPKILYDSFCKICNAEIEYYKKKDPNQVFEYLDIMNPKFDSNKYNLTKKQVHKYFHVVTEEDIVIQGVDAFDYIWKKLDIFKPLQLVYDFAPSRLILKLGYKGFIYIRPLLPRKKDCDDYCEF